MDQQRNAQCFDTFVKRPEKLAVEIFAVDVLVNDDGMKPSSLIAYSASAMPRRTSCKGAVATPMNRSG